jgi:hypothetical protein
LRFEKFIFEKFRHPELVEGIRHMRDNPYAGELKSIVFGWIVQFPEKRKYV